MKTLTLKTLPVVVLSVITQQALASGYHFGTQSVTAQSTANASAAEAADASTIFFNPAGLTRLKNHELTAALNVVMPSIHYKAVSAKYRGGADIVGGSTSGKITDTAVAAPHIYGAYKFNDRTTFGLGVYIPFASSTEYQRDSVIRYNMNRLGLTTVALEPVIAYQTTDKLSLAAGFIAQYSKAQLRKYADWGVNRGASGLMDGYADVEGDDWGYGYHLAALYDITPSTRIGLNYRSQVSHDLRGNAQWYAASPLSIQNRAAFSQAGYAEDENAHISIVTPESLSLHAMHQLNNQINLFADLTWTRHSRFKDAVLYFGNQKMVGADAQGNPILSNTTTLNPNWRNTWRASLGASYQYSQALQLRAGFAFDQTPVRNEESRMVTLPDGNRMWFSLGLKYNINDQHIFDVAYTHIHIKNASVNAEGSTGKDVDSKGAVKARFNNYANIIGVQYNYKF